MIFNLTTDFNSINIAEYEWNSLAARNQTNTIFQTHQWFMSWWEACGFEFKLALVTGTSDKELKLIAPLMISTEKKGNKILRFACDENSDYCDLIISVNEEKIIQDFLLYLIKSDLDFDRIVLKNIPSTSSTHNNFFNACRALKIPASYGTTSVSPKLFIKDNELSAERILNKYSVCRPYNKLIRHGKLNFKIVNLCNKSELNLYLSKFTSQHIKRFFELGKQSLFIEEKYNKLYLNLINNMSHKSWISFSVLEFDGEPIAFHFGFIYENRLIWYKPTFDIKYSKFSPGSTLLKLLIEHAKEHNIVEVDLTLGDEAYKRRFSNCVTYNETIYIYKSKLDYIVQRLRRVIINLLKRFSKRLKIRS